MSTTNEILASADTSHVTRDLMFIKPVVEMPQTGQLVATIVFALLALATLVYVLKTAKKNNSSFPIWIYVGSVCAIPFETFDLTLGHCLYPQLGQWTALEILGIKLPLFLVFIYPVYITGMMTFVFDRMNQGTMTLDVWWKTAAVGIISAAAFEPPALYFGLWLYFGDNEPFRIFGLPFWWAFANPVAIITMGLLCFHFWNTLLKRKYTPLVVLTLPITLFAVHTGVSWPVYLAINTTPDTTITNLAALITAAMSLFVFWLGSHAISDSAKRAG